MDISARSAAADATSRPRPRMGLSGKLLVLTLLFVMIAEVLIYVPSVANFRLNWLNDRLSAAYTAALVFETAPSGELPEAVARQILESIGARAVVLKMGQHRGRQDHDALDVGAAKAFQRAGGASVKEDLLAGLHGLVIGPENAAAHKIDPVHARLPECGRRPASGISVCRLGGGRIRADARVPDRSCERRRSLVR